MGRHSQGHWFLYSQIHYTSHRLSRWRKLQPWNLLPLQTYRPFRIFRLRHFVFGRVHTSLAPLWSLDRATWYFTRKKRCKMGVIDPFLVLIQQKRRKRHWYMKWNGFHSSTGMLLGVKLGPLKPEFYSTIMSLENPSMCNPCCLDWRGFCLLWAFRAMQKLLLQFYGAQTRWASSVRSQERTEFKLLMIRVLVAVLLYSLSRRALCGWSMISWTSGR